MTHTGEFDPSGSKVHGGGAQGSAALDARFTSVENADEVQKLRDMLGELWPAALQPIPTNNQTGGAVAILGDGWKSGATVTLYADNVAGLPGPFEMGKAVASRGRGGFVVNFAMNHGYDVPPEKQTDITLRGVGGGEEVRVPLPGYVFYA